MSECNWEDVGQDWNIFDQLWNDIIPCVEEMLGYIMQGEPPEDAYAKAAKDKRLRRKIIKVILILKGHSYTQVKEIGNLDKYKVTTNDINLLIEEYQKRKDELSIIIDDVIIR